MDPQKGIITYSGVAMNPVTHRLHSSIIELDSGESRRIKAMIDSGVITGNTVFRCEAIVKGKYEERYVNMINVREVKFEY